MPLARASAALLLCLPLMAYAQPQAKPEPQVNAKDDVKELHARLQRAVAAEQVRAKQPVCPSATSTVDINSCLAEELAATGGNYLEAVRAIGALMRAMSGPSSSGTSTRIPFDDAEDTWLAYRKQACNAASDLYRGGTVAPSVNLSCQITLTRSHLASLGLLYGDLGTH